MGPSGIIVLASPTTSTYLVCTSKCIVISYAKLNTAELIVAWRLVAGHSDWLKS